MADDMRAMYRDNGFVTIPVSDEAQAAIEAWIVANGHELDAILEQFGFNLNAVQFPRVRQLLFERRKA